MGVGTLETVGRVVVVGMGVVGVMVGKGFGAAVGVMVGTGVGVAVGNMVETGVGAAVGTKQPGTQTCHPEYVTEPSEYHDMLVLGETQTPSGPEPESYLTPSIVR